MLTESPAWVWPNKDDEQVRHSPLIDDKLNIYVSTTRKLRKFDRLGQLQWTFKLDEKAVTSPTLHHGKIYILSGCGSDSGKMYLYALHMENGKIDWNVTLEGQCMGEASSILAVNEMLILPYRTKLTNGEEDGLNTLGGGANGVRAVSLNNGTHLWDYVTDQLMWNFAPSTPGDGTLIFSSCCGAVFRISLEKGETIWKTEAPNGIKNTFCGTGVGPNGIFYSEFNTSFSQWREKGHGGSSQCDRRCKAVGEENGERLWWDTISCCRKLGPSGKLSVVVARWWGRFFLKIFLWIFFVIPKKTKPWGKMDFFHPFWTWFANMFQPMGVFKKKLKHNKPGWSGSKHQCSLAIGWWEIGTIPAWLGLPWRLEGLGPREENPSPGHHHGCQTRHPKNSQNSSCFFFCVFFWGGTFLQDFRFLSFKVIFHGTMISMILGERVINESQDLFSTPNIWHI